MTADTVGGVWTYTMTLCNALATHADVYLLTLGGFMSESQKQQATAMPHVQVFETDHKLEWMQDPWEDVSRTTEKVDVLYHELQPHLMHFNNYVQIQDHWNCGIVTVFHSCVQTWFRAVKGEAPGAEWDRYTATVSNALKASDVVVFPTSSLKAMAEDAYGFVDNGLIIHNGSATTSSVHASAKEPFILSAGRLWDEAKNTNILSNISGQLPWPVKLAGNPGAETENDVYSGVELLGTLSAAEMQEMLQKAAVFVSPALYEPFGLAVLEAATAGCALALADIPTFRELWAGAAVFFDPRDEQDVLRTVTSLVTNNALRQELSEKARQQSLQYAVDDMAHNYLLLYHKLAAGKAVSIT